MIPRTRIPAVLAIIGLLSSMSIPSVAQQTEKPAVTPPPDPLAAFERLIGGEWHLEGSYQVLEWGVGRKSVRTRSYFASPDGPKLVSEGVWFWHPGEKKIRGFATAIDMPVAFFDYTMAFDGGTMKSDLIGYSPRGRASSYVETWELTDGDHYVWTLYAKAADSLSKVMGGTYVRKNSRKP